MVVPLFAIKFLVSECVSVRPFLSPREKRSEPFGRGVRGKNFALSLFLLSPLFSKLSNSPCLSLLFLSGRESRRDFETASIFLPLLPSAQK